MGSDQRELVLAIRCQHSPLRCRTQSRKDDTMTVSPKSRPAIKLTRSLFVKAGLSENEAQSLLDRVGGEFVAGCVDNSAAQVDSIRRDVAVLKTELENLNKNSGVRRELIIGGIAGVGSSYIVNVIDKVAAAIGDRDLLRAASPMHPQLPETLGVEWTARRLSDVSQLLPLVRRALEIHQGTSGKPDNRMAFYLDGIGMLLDAQNSHRLAQKQRQDAIRICQKVHGPIHESTGAALTNLGVCRQPKKDMPTAKPILR